MRLRVVWCLLIVCVLLAGCGILGRMQNAEDNPGSSVNLIPRVKGEE
jgi:hypothetical protein